MSSPPRRPSERADNDIADYAPLTALVGRIVDALPSGSPAAWREPTYRTVLSAVISDRLENDTGDLEEGDVESLAEFVRAAATAAAGAPTEFRDAAYEIVLEGLLQDWVENWNESDDDDEEDE